MQWQMQWQCKYLGVFIKVRHKEGSSAAFMHFHTFEFAG